MKKHVIGILHTTSKGFGFVSSKDLPADAFIARNNLNYALDEDEVEIEVFPSPKGPEGIVRAIRRRGRTHLVCAILGPGKKNYRAISPTLESSLELQIETKTKLKKGDRILTKVMPGKGKVKCEFVKKLGHIDDASCDIECAIYEFNLPVNFKKEALKEAESFSAPHTKKELKTRSDFTKLEIFTIDPESAKDFDDALSVVKTKTGYHLGVHIADVSYYVKATSLLDEEALLRGNSVYMPGKTLPMLPEHLSNDLCSLKPNVIRAAVSIMMDFDLKGELKKSQIVRSFIKSQKRFIYEDASEILEGKQESPFKKSLQNLQELALLLKAQRAARGSIDFNLTECRLKLDKKGNPIEIVEASHGAANQLVEEFMLKANEVMATELCNRKIDAIYRVHEEPPPEIFADYYDFVRALGFTLPQAPSREDLQKMFAEALKTSYAKAVSISFIRSMRLAQYSAENTGHYGLSIENYCHATSPIRRYSDIIIHRLLLEEPLPLLELQKIATVCSGKERIAFKAEAKVMLLKKLRLIKKHFDKNPDHIYEAVISKIKPFGIYFEIDGFFLEGSLHVSELKNDFYLYDPEFMRLQGRNKRQSYAFGDKIFLRLLNVDLLYMDTSWKLVFGCKNS